jgi:hypothetical protein
VNVDNYCAGHVQLRDGRLLSVGGNDPTTNGLVQWGLSDARTYSPFTGAWDLKPTMMHPRWYPTATTLRDGRVFVASGNRGGHMWFFGGRRDGALPAPAEGALLHRFGRVPGGYWDQSMTPFVDQALPAPAVREGHTMVYLSDASTPDLHGQVVFGGRNGGGPVDTDVWFLRREIGDWTAAEYEFRWKRLDLPLAGRPDPRSEHTAIARSNTEMVVFGGIRRPEGGGDQVSGDLWRLYTVQPGGQWSWEALPAAPGARWGHAAVYDGPNQRMIVFGGAESLDGATLADSRVWTYSFTSSTWSELPVLDDGASRRPDPRRDHAMVRAPGGQIFLYGGHFGGGASSDTLWQLDVAVSPAVWTPLATTGTSPGPRAGHSLWYDPDLTVGRLVLFGGEPAPSAPVDGQIHVIQPLAATKQWAQWNGPGFRLSGHVAVIDPYGAPFSRIPEIFDPETDTWTSHPDAARFETYYPIHFLVPGYPTGGGRLVSVGQEPQARYLDIPPAGQPMEGWKDVGAPLPGGGNGGDSGFWPLTGVMYEPGKILVAGGYPGFGNTPIGTCKTIDLNDVTNGWVSTGSMAARYFHNLVILPNGDVMVVGGASSTQVNNTISVPCPQIWSPATGAWTAVNDLQCDRDNGVNVLRNYHSTAVLLPDGRILSAGGVVSGYRLRVRAYCPPYLFRPDGVTPARRPVIGGWPRAIGWGGTFTIETPDAADVEKVALLRPAATTHAFDQNQRYMPLTIVARHTDPPRLVVEAPPGPDHAPPATTCCSWSARASPTRRSRPTCPRSRSG